MSQVEDLGSEKNIVMAVILKARAKELRKGYNEQGRQTPVKGFVGHKHARKQAHTYSCTQAQIQKYTNCTLETHTHTDQCWGHYYFYVNDMLDEAESYLNMFTDTKIM